MPVVRSVFKAVLLVLVILTAAYVGTGAWVRADLDHKIAEGLSRPGADEKGGGVIYEGVPFKSKEALLLYLTDEKAQRFFPWVFEVPDLGALVIGAIAFGVVGGMVRCLKSVLADKQAMPLAQYGLECALGVLVAIIVLVAVYSIPAAILASTKSRPYPASILAMALVGSVFSRQTIDFLESRLKAVFGGK